MARFVIDEDMPRSTAAALRSQGHDVLDIRDHGFRGSSDEKIYEFAQGEKAILLTGDLGFSNILKFPLGQHRGIVVARFPNEMNPRELNAAIIAGFEDLDENDFKGSLIILEPHRIRIKRPPH